MKLWGIFFFFFINSKISFYSIQHFIITIIKIFLFFFLLNSKFFSSFFLKKKHKLKIKINKFNKKFSFPYPILAFYSIVLIIFYFLIETSVEWECKISIQLISYCCCFPDQTRGFWLDHNFTTLISMIMGTVVLPLIIVVITKFPPIFFFSFFLFNSNFHFFQSNIRKK